MKSKFNELFSDLITYDYILFGAIFLIFILLVIFSLLLRQKKALSLFLAIFSFLFLLITPFFGYSMMHNEIFKKQITLQSHQKLEFTKAVVIYGKLKNISNRDFQTCLVTATLHKANSNKLKNFIYQFKPLQKMSIMEEDIIIEDEIDFKIIVSPFTYTNEYSVKLEASCR